MYNFDPWAMIQSYGNSRVRNERRRIVALLESEVWDSPEIATPYVQHIIALIKDESA
jgi:hypothetical protein